MPRDPVSDNGCELADLESEAAIVPGSEPKCIFIKPDLSAVITRVEAAVESRLRKEIDLRANLGVEEESQTRVKEIVDFAVDESRRRLLKVITFDVNCAAESRAKIVLKRRDGERGIEPIEQVIDFECACGAGEKKKAEDSKQLHTVSIPAIWCGFRHPKK